MTQSAHTPGPWTYAYHSSGNEIYGHAVIGSDQFEVVYFDEEGRLLEEANARLNPSIANQ